MSPTINAQFNSDELKRQILNWPQTEQVIFIALFVDQKPKDQVAHDVGLPLAMLEQKIEAMLRKLQITRQQENLALPDENAFSR